MTLQTNMELIQRRFTNGMRIFKLPKILLVSTTLTLAAVHYLCIANSII